MASAMEPPPEAQAQRRNGTNTDGHIASPLEPSTPQDTGPPESSQVTLPSTEIPHSPVDPSSSFKTEVNDDHPTRTVIPSSLTPPPSTQAAPQHHNHHSSNVRRGGAYTQSQQSTLFSPPATILNHAPRDRSGGGGGAGAGTGDIAPDFVPPAPDHILEAGADELRAMLQTCIAEHQKLKMETAHHKLQYSLLSLQAEEESKRAAVEHDMMRKEVDALRSAEHVRQAKRELSAASDATHAKYLRMKTWYENAMEENEGLHHRLKLAKKVIQQKDDENLGLVEERDMLLNRIRENREHFHMLCSPGGVLHGALTPRQHTSSSTPLQARATPRQAPRSIQRHSQDDRDAGLSLLFQAMSQDNNNNSAPSTPVTPRRSVARGGVGGGGGGAKHHRHAQSLSSLPTTPMHRVRGEHAGLLPSVDLVPQTEPAPRYSSTRHFVPETPTSRREQQRARRSRESTISADDNEELARQALQSVGAVQSFATSRGGGGGGGGGSQHSSNPPRRIDPVQEEIFDSQASQAATELLRRDPRESFEVASSRGSRDASPPSDPKDQSARMQAKLLSGLRDKRKFSGGHGGGGGGAAQEEEHAVRRDYQSSPTKRMKVGGPLADDQQRVGLGIQYSR